MAVELSVETIYNMDISQLYEVLLDICDDSKEARKVKEIVDKGIILEFPINRLLNNWYETFPIANQTRVFGYGKVSLNVFCEEVEKRKCMIRRAIFDNMKPKEVVGIYGQ